MNRWKMQHLNFLSTAVQSMEGVSEMLNKVSIVLITILSSFNNPANEFLNNQLKTLSFLSNLSQKIKEKVGTLLALIKTLSTKEESMII